MALVGRFASGLSLAPVANGASKTINGNLYYAENAGRGYSQASGTGVDWFYLGAGDGGNTGSVRSEWDGYPTSFTDGNTFWISYWQFIALPSVFHNWTVSGQVHHGTISGAGDLHPPIAMFFNSAGTISLISATNNSTPPLTDTQTTQYSGAFTAGVGHNLVHQIKLDPTGSGIWNCWIDGVQRVTFAGAIGYPTDPGAFLKYGAYRAEDGTNAFGVYFANVEVQTATLAARIATPLAPPF
jgi:hypothetical protein